MTEPSSEQVNYYRELYTRGWEKFTFRELPKEEKLEIARAVSQECDEVLNKARMRAKLKAIEKLEKDKKKDTGQSNTFAVRLAKIEEEKV